MTDSHPLDELAELTALVRAHLESGQGRGARSIRAGEALPPQASPAAAEKSGTRTPPSRLGDWSQVAEASRSEGTPGSDGHGAAGLERIRRDLGECTRCGLCQGRTNIVFGVGHAEADLLVVGEAPGFNEDRRGEPFVGKAGQMLDKMLLNVLGLPRERVYIANVVKCRPPENRNPQPDEVARCLPFLDRQIRAVDPRVVLVLGSVALRALFPNASGITRERGNWREYRGVPVLPTFHPAYLLRRPEGKRATFNDLKALRDRYDSLGGRR